MILAIDIGNTNVVLGGIEGNDILFEARMATDSIKTSDQYCAELKNILALFDVVPSMIDGTIVASVVPPVLNSFRTAIRKLTGKSCLVVGPGIRRGGHGPRFGRSGTQGVGGGRFPVFGARLHPGGPDDGIGQAPFIHELAASRRGRSQHQPDAGPQEEKGLERGRVHRPA